MATALSWQFYSSNWTITACSCESEDLGCFFEVLVLDLEDKVKNLVRFSSYSYHQESYLLE